MNAAHIKKVSQIWHEVAFNSKEYTIATLKKEASRGEQTSHVGDVNEIMKRQAPKMEPLQVKIAGSCKHVEPTEHLDWAYSIVRFEKVRKQWT